MPPKRCFSRTAWDPGSGLPPSSFIARFGSRSSGVRVPHPVNSPGPDIRMKGIMHAQRENLYGAEAAEINERLADLGAKPYAGRQVCAWLYRRKARDFAEMTDLSAALR